MGELRRDPIAGRWVLVDTDNPKGPQDFAKEERFLRQIETCQFCPGKEAQTPPEIEAFRDEGSVPNSPGWSVRVIPNKFPVLRIEGNINKKGVGLFDMSNGIGAHEIIIDSPEHDLDMPDYSEDQMVRVINKYCSRQINLAQDKRFKYILIFRNFGESSGASVEHPHSQIIALPTIPKYVQLELDGAQVYDEYRGRCIFCDIIAQEKEDKSRIVIENDGFICFCPYVSRFSFETWILPKDHKRHFCEITAEEKVQLAQVLKEILKRYKEVLPSQSYNFFVHTAPVNDEKAGIFHWHIELVPRLFKEAGMEWGTGLYVVPTTSDLAAKHLRQE